MSGPITNNSQLAPQDLPPVLSPEELAQSDSVKEAGKVSVGHDTANSVSHRTAGTDAQFSPEAKPAPTIPEPNSATTPTGEDLSSLHSQSFSSQARAGLLTSYDLLSKNQPEIISEESTAKVGKLMEMLARVESAPDDVKSGILTTVKEFVTAAQSGTLDADKLEQILAEIQSKMDDNSIKYSEVEINGRADEAEMRSDKNIEKIREFIEEAKHSEQSQNDPFFFLKVLACIFFPPLAIWESANAIARAATDDVPPISLFTYANDRQVKQGFDVFGSEIKGAFDAADEDLKCAFSEEKWNNIGDQIQTSLGVNPKTGVPFKVEEREKALYDSIPAAFGHSDALPATESTTLEGLETGQSAMTQSEMMKMLLQIQQSDESKEKLSEAIAALESGSPQAAAEILSGLFGSSLGNDITSALTAAPDASEMLNRVLGFLESGMPEAAAETLTNLFDGFIDSNVSTLQYVANVAEETAQNAEAALLEVAKMARGRFM